MEAMAHRNRWFTWVYLLKMVIFHGELLNNQMVFKIKSSTCNHFMAMIMWMFVWARDARTLASSRFFFSDQGLVYAKLEQEVNKWIRHKPME